MRKLIQKFPAGFEGFEGPEGPEGLEGLESSDVRAQEPQEESTDSQISSDSDTLVSSDEDCDCPVYGSPKEVDAFAPETPRGEVQVGISA